MNDIYTEYVAGLAGGERPTKERVEAVCERLRLDLRRALGRRGLWSASPALLGMPGTTWHLELLDDLVQGAYLYSFVERLRYLQRRLEPGVSLRPLVRRNVESFLSRCQRKVDPVGRRIFVRLRAALRAAVARGELFLIDAADSEPDVHNDRILGFRPRLPVVAAPETLAEAVGDWEEELFADLVTATTNAVAGVEERLARRLLGLADAGVDGFRFKDLADLVKRRAWNWTKARLDDGETIVVDREDDGFREVVRIVRPDDEPDGQRRLLLLERCVSCEIERLADRRTRDQLWQVWEQARSSAAQGLPRPSFARLGRRLGIPRERRLPKLYRLLGEIVERCRQDPLRSPASAASRER